MGNAILDWFYNAIRRVSATASQLKVELTGSDGVEKGTNANPVYVADSKIAANIWTPANATGGSITVAIAAGHAGIVGYVGVVSDAIATFTLSIGATVVWRKTLPANTPDGQYFGPGGIATLVSGDDIVLACSAGTYQINLGSKDVTL